MAKMRGFTGAQVKRIRQRLGENQAQFAERFAVNQATISRWEAFGLDGGPSVLLLKAVDRETRQLRRATQPIENVA